MDKKKFLMFAGSDGDGGNEGDGNPTPTPPPDPKPEQHSPTDEEAKLIKEVMEKKARLKEQDQKIEQLEGALKKFEDIGGFEVFQKLVNEKAEAEKKSLEEKGEWAKLREQMASEHEKAVAGMKSEIEELKKTIGIERGKIAEMTVGSAFNNSQFLRDKTILPPSKARTVYGDYFDISESGELVAFDKPRGSEGRVALVDQSGNGVNFETAIERIISADPDHESLLRAVEKKGAGSGTSGGRVEKKTETKLTGLSMIASGLANFK